MPKRRSEFTCPICGYDQRGIIASWTDACPLRGACSECGSAIDWREVHRPELFAQTRYYEHLRSGSFGDLFWTIRRAFRPGLLWTWIPRSQPLAARRLLTVSLFGAIATTLLTLLIVPLIGLGTMYILYSSIPVTGPVGRSFYYDPLSYTRHVLPSDLYFEGSIWVSAIVFHTTTVFVAGVWALLARSRGVRLAHIVRFGLLTPIPLSMLVVADSLFYTAQAVHYYDMYYLGTGSIAWLRPIIDIAFTDALIATMLLITLAWFWHAWVMFMTRYLRAARPRLTVLAYGLVSLLLMPFVGGALFAIFG